MFRRIVLVSILISVIILTLYACAETEVVLTSISIGEGSMKTSYSLNETIDLTDAKIVLTYSDGNTEEISVTEDMVTGFSTANVGTYSMVIRYLGRSVSLAYTVSVNNTITIVSAVPEGFKTEYFLNETFDYADAIIRVTYSDQTSETFPVTSGMIVASSFNTKSVTAVNTPRRITVNVNTKAGNTSCTADYVVRQRAAIHSFSIANEPELIFQRNAANASALLDTILSMQEYFVVYADDLENEIEVGYEGLTLLDFDTSTIGNNFELRLRFSDAYSRTAELSLTYSIIEPVQEFEVTYNENFESGSIIISDTVNGKAPLRSVANRAGYEFLGWYRKTGDIYANYPWNFSTMVEADMTLYARWSAITYSIDYAGVAQNSLNAEEFTSYNVNSNIALYTEEKEGYIFEGFDMGGGNIITTIAKGTTGNLNLVAVWTPIEYDLTYSYNGGTAPQEPNPSSLTVESVFSLNPPTRNGYEFIGWKINGTEQIIQSIASGYTQDISLTAEWSIITYTISYVLLENENIQGNSPSSYKVTDSIIYLTPAEKINYTFMGWCKDEARTILMPQIGGESVIYAGSTGDLTLYAKFFRKYELLFDSVGGEILIGEEPIDNLFFNENDVTVTLPTASKLNSVFMGWRSGVTIFQAGEVDAADLKALIASGYYSLSLQAVWSEE